MTLPCMLITFGRPLQCVPAPDAAEMLIPL
jgi:hypothetical protein